MILVSSDYIALFELTVITNTKHHFTAASLRKQDHYGPLLQDLQDSVSSVDLVTIEIGCLGHFTPETISKLSETTKNIYAFIASTSC